MFNILVFCQIMLRIVKFLDLRAQVSTYDIVQALLTLAAAARSSTKNTSLSTPAPSLPPPCPLSIY